VVRYDDTGSVRWARSLSAGSGESGFGGIVVDSRGNSYAVGAAIGSSDIDFGGGVRVKGPAKSRNLIVAKYDPSGRTLWAKTAEAGLGGSDFTGIAADTFGEVLAVGGFGKGLLSLGDGVSVTGMSSRGNPLIVKYNALGVAQWAHTVKGISTDYYCRFDKVAGDKSGNSYVVGTVAGSDTYDFGSGIALTITTNFSTPTHGSAVLVKYDPSGTTLWARTAAQGSAAPESHFNNVAVDYDSNAFVVGEVESDEMYDFGGNVRIEAASAGGNLINFIGKYDPSGRALWAQRASGSERAGGAFFGLAIERNGNACAAGYVFGLETIDFGSGVSSRGAFERFGSFNQVLVEFSSSGVALTSWTPKTASESNAFHAAMADNQGNIYAVGSVDGGETLDSGGVAFVSGFGAIQSAVLAKFH
jgi:hypothetical protein